MIESQSVINSSMIMMYGATVKMSEKIELCVLNLQTIALASYLHHILTLKQTLIIKNVSNTEETEKLVDIVTFLFLNLIFHFSGVIWKI